MQKLTDEELIEEIRQRFAFNRSALNDLRAMTRKLEEMNEKLRESEALKSQFLSNIRNEINNPLSAIMGLSAQLSQQQCTSDASLRNAQMIYAEAFNLDFQLQNIFMAAELEAGEAAPSFAMVELEAVIKGCIDKLAARAAAKGVSITSSVPEDLIFPTDARKFELLLINLLANGVEFNRPQGRLEIRVEEDEAGLTVTVVDDGPGIATADQEIIFDRFRQLDSGTTKGHQGHGLGLSICRSLAELLDGGLGLDSRTGEGSRFVLTLPRPQVEVAVHAKDANFFLFDSDAETERF